MELKEKQKKILDVAVELFKEKGYMGSSVRDLATKLNIKAASLYAHIRSKEEILEGHHHLRLGCFVTWSRPMH